MDLGKGIRVMLAKKQLSQTKLVDWQNLLTTDSATDTGRHFGSRITFDDSGHVYFGVGDRGVVEVQLFELRQAFQMRQSGIGDLGLVQVQVINVVDAGEIGDSGVGDLGSGEVEMIRVRRCQHLDERQSGISQCGLCQGNVRDILEAF